MLRPCHSANGVPDLTVFRRSHDRFEFWIITRIWATTRGGQGVVYSDDLGQTWASAAGNGLTDRDVNDLAIESGTGKRIWATTDNGVFFSENDGASWTPRTLGLPAGVAVTSVAIDPNSQEVLVSLFSEEGGGVYRGGGATGVWTSFNEGLDQLKVRKLSRDAGYTIDATTSGTRFYASTSGSGVFRAELRTTTEDGPTITTTSLPLGFERAPYEAVLGASGGVVPYRWSIAKGELPAGFRIDAESGTITGSPVETGHWLLTVQVADANQKVASRDLVLQVDPAEVAFDLDLDGDNDIVWRNYGDGKNAVWYMSGAVRSGYGFYPTLGDTNWKLVGLGEWNGDGQADLLWRNHSTGKNAIWYMSGLTRIGYAYMPSLPDPNWTIAAVGDYDGDGAVDDLLWRHGSTGENAYWYMSNATRTGYAYLATVTDAAWKIVGTGDFDLDGDEDIVWRHETLGLNGIWYMNGATMEGLDYAPKLVDPAWQIMGVADFDGDHRPDFLWRNTTTGANAYWYMKNTVRTGYDYLLKLSDQNWKIEGPR